ncbi:MAG: FtsX-like permease family protein [Dehalococcoidia bacterium]|nr:FtsX-like permease family protein [Dehalococcoidia bacterium]
MPPVTTTSFVLKRLADDWKLLAAIFAGVTVAAALLASAPIYLKTLERQGIDTAIDRADQSFLNIYGAAPHILLSRERLDATERTFEDAIANNVQEIYRGHERYLKSPTFLVGTKGNPLDRNLQNSEQPPIVSRGYFQHMTNLEDHVTFIEGRMATDEIARNGRNPRIEAVVGYAAKRNFGLNVGDTVIFTPSLSDPTRVVIEVVGMLEATDPTEEYWLESPDLYINPVPLEETPDADVEVDPEEPPLALFVTREALIEGVGVSYPGTLVSSNWFVFIDKENLKKWDKDEVRARLADMESEVSNVMQGSAVFTGIETMLRRFERRSFFTGIPMLLLLVVMTITVLYYILMMVSYLVTSREQDVALLRSRGVGSWHLARIYALEGLGITLIAAIIAPFLALGAIALAGKLSYFEDITLGRFLPVSLEWTPFLVSLAAGALCLAIYVVPGVIGARTGLIVQKMRAARPPSEPFFHRYYIDIGLMVIGGLIFWELFSRGQIVSGGLFNDARVNEALLFAPVLLLTVVALLFMRFFPLVVRYLSGESPTVMHLLAAATFITIALMTAVQELRTDAGWGWIWRMAHLGIIAALYAGTWRIHRRHFLTAGLILQAATTALFVYNDLPDRDAALYIPTLILALLVPMQFLFLALRRLERAYPVWASMAIWRMARNPLQYSWLVLLIVMVTGLGVLATTVGGTLDRSYEERVLYDVAADIRVTGIPTYFARGTESLKERYLALPGITSLSLVLRAGGSVGATYSGNSFGVLAVESEEFPYVSWYRDDFSERPLAQVMGFLKTGAGLPPIEVPRNADRIYVWAHPAEEYSNIFLWMVLKDRRGIINTVTLGPVQGEEWTLMGGRIPDNLVWPISLVSVQIYEPAFGPAGTAGTLFLDDIQVSVRGETERHILDDFEGASKWTPLATSMISRDVIGATRDEVKNGERSGVFIFGKDTDQGIRGFYRSPTGGPMPVVASSTFLERTGTQVGSALVVNILSSLVPVRIMDAVEYFPTMDPAGNGFLIADLDNLLRHLNILSPVDRIDPNELLLTYVPGTEDEINAIAHSLAPRNEFVHSRATMLENIRLDPLITAGWRAMILIAFAVIVFAATLGYVTYLLSFAGQSRAEMGFLQALGLRHRQMAWLLIAEHLVIAVIGLAIGTAAGFFMSNIMVSSVAVTENGRPVVPPYILTTDWAFMGAIYVVLAVIFVGALLWLARSVTRVNLYEMTRVEGE